MPDLGLKIYYKRHSIMNIFERILWKFSYKLPLKFQKIFEKCLKYIFEVHFQQSLKEILPQFTWNFACVISNWEQLMGVWEWLGLSISYKNLNSYKTQDVNSTYIRRSKDVLDVFWTPYVRSVYVLCLRG